MPLNGSAIKAILARRDAIQQELNGGTAGWGYSLHRGNTFASSQPVLNPDGVTHPRIMLLSVSDEALVLDSSYGQAKTLYRVTYLAKDGESIDDLILNQTFWLKPENGEAFRVQPIKKETKWLGSGFWYLYFS